MDTPLAVLPINEVRRRLHQFAADFDARGPDCEPVVFGSHRRPQGVLLPWAAWAQNSFQSGSDRSRSHASPVTGSTRTGPERVGPTRAKILRAAVAVMLEKGFTATRMSDVAKEAGVSSGLIAYHFKTRESVLAAALRRAEDQFEGEADAALAGTFHAGDRLRTWIELSFRPEGESPIPRMWRLWLDVWARGLVDPAMRHARDTMDKRSRKRVAQIVDEGRNSGQFLPVDTDLFTRMLSTMMDGLGVALLLDDTTLSNDQAIELACRLCAHELGSDWLARDDMASASNLNAGD